MCVGVAVVSFGKIPVEGGDNGVGTFTGFLIALPLSDTGAACVGNDGGSGIFKYLQDAVALGREAYLF